MAATLTLIRTVFFRDKDWRAVELRTDEAIMFRFSRAVTSRFEVLQTYIFWLLTPRAKQRRCRYFPLILLFSSEALTLDLSAHYCILSFLSSSEDRVSSFRTLSSTHITFFPQGVHLLSFLPSPTSLPYFPFIPSCSGSTHLIVHHWVLLRVRLSTLLWDGGQRLAHHRVVVGGRRVHGIGGALTAGLVTAFCSKGRGRERCYSGTLSLGLSWRMHNWSLR